VPDIILYTYTKLWIRILFIRLSHCINVS